jgi:hypothetical protein
MKYDYNILEEKIKSLPRDMQVAMFSPEISEKVQAVAEKYSLDIEQTGILMDITGYVMLALIPSKNFVVELAKEAQIDATKAAQIATDINNDVFSSIRESLRKIQDLAENNQADLEKAGDLSVEKDSTDQMGAAATVSTADAMLSQADVLNSIENPEVHSNLPINILTPVPAPTAAVPGSALVDRLMGAPVATPNETVEKKMPAPEPTPKTRPGPDPYREPIE